MVKHNLCANISADIVLVYRHIKSFLKWLLVLALYLGFIDGMTAIPYYSTPKRSMTLTQMMSATNSQYVSSNWWADYAGVLIICTIALIFFGILSAILWYFKKKIYPRLKHFIGSRWRCYRINVRDALIQKKYK